MPIYLETKKQEGITDKYLYHLERRVKNYLLPVFPSLPTYVRHGARKELE